MKLLCPLTASPYRNVPLRKQFYYIFFLRAPFKEAAKKGRATKEVPTATKLKGGGVKTFSGRATMKRTFFAAYLSSSIYVLYKKTCIKSLCPLTATYNWQLWLNGFM